MAKRADHKFRAVRSQDADTCHACNWAWLSVEPMVLATGDTAEEAEEAAWGRAPEASGIHVHEVQ